MGTWLRSRQLGQLPEIALISSRFKGDTGDRWKPWSEFWLFYSPPRNTYCLLETCHLWLNSDSEFLLIFFSLSPTSSAQFSPALSCRGRPTNHVSTSPKISTLPRLALLVCGGLGTSDIWPQFHSCKNLYRPSNLFAPVDTFLCPGLVSPQHWGVASRAGIFSRVWGGHEITLTSEWLKNWFWKIFSGSRLNWQRCFGWDC